MVLFFFSNFFRGLGMLKGLNQSLCGNVWFGRFLRPGNPVNSPSGAEGATMEWRAQFPLSRIPTSIEHSMKLLCVCLQQRLSESNWNRACV